MTSDVDRIVEELASGTRTWGMMTTALPDVDMKSAMGEAVESGRVKVLMRAQWFLDVCGGNLDAHIYGLPEVKP